MPRSVVATLLLLAGVTVWSPAAQAKKGSTVATRDPSASADPAPAASGGGTQQAQMAQLQATMSLAQVRVARAGVAEEPLAADVKQKLGDLYDREESATQDGLAKLRAAQGDAAKVAAAAAVIQAAPTERRRYLSANPTTADAINRRVTLINTELELIAGSPDKYLATLKGLGVGEPAYSKASAAVHAAAKSSGGRADNDAAGTVLSARSQVRAMLSAKQVRALDAAMSGGPSGSAAPGAAPENAVSPTKRRRPA